jgi:hypothetical protein
MRIYIFCNWVVYNERKTKYYKSKPKTKQKLKRKRWSHKERDHYRWRWFYSKFIEVYVKSKSPIEFISLSYDSKSFWSAQIISNANKIKDWTNKAEKVTDLLYRTDGNWLFYWNLWIGPWNRCNCRWNYWTV